MPAAARREEQFVTILKTLSLHLSPDRMGVDIVNWCSVLWQLWINKEVLQKKTERRTKLNKCNNVDNTYSMLIHLQINIIKSRGFSYVNFSRRLTYCVGVEDRGVL